MKAFRSVVVVGVFLVSIVVPALPAAADVGLFTYLTMFSGTVGEADRPGSFILRNNTSPHSNETNIVRDIRLAPSCGTVGTLVNLCSVVEPGVFSIGSVATARGGTTCAGRTFNVSDPDASGTVTFTPDGVALTLPPQNPATEAFEDCIVDFNYSVLKTPTIDTNRSSPLTRPGPTSWSPSRARPAA